MALIFPQHRRHLRCIPVEALALLRLNMELRWVIPASFITYKVGDISWTSQVAVRAENEHYCNKLKGGYCASCFEKARRK